MTGTVSLATALTAWLLIGLWIAWSACCWLSPEWLVIGLAAMALLNGIALLVLLFWRSPWAIAALTGVQAGNVAFSIAAAVAVSLAWLPLFTAPALVALILGVLVGRPEANRSGAKLRS
jgi:hypothetical protein